MKLRYLKRTSSQELIFWISIFLLLSLSILGSILYKVNKNQLIREIEYSRNNLADKLVVSLKLPIWNYNFDTVSQILSPFLSSDSLAGAKIELPNGNSAFDKKENQSDKYKLSETKRKIIYKNHTLGTLHLFFSDKELTTRLQDLGLVISIQIFSTFILLILGLSFLLNLIQKKPLKELLNEITKVSAGNYNVKMHSSRQSDINQINDALNIMSKQIEVREKYQIKLNRKLTLLNKELSESENKYKSLFNYASDAIFFISDNKFTECNTKTLELFACTRNQIIGKPLSFFSPKQQPDGSLSESRIMSYMNKALSTEPQFFEWRYSKYDGTTFDAEISLNRLEISDKIFILAIVRDITAKNNAVKLKIAAEAAEKTAKAKSDFLAKMSHEIRTPMNAIIGLNYLLLHDEITSKQRNYLQKVDYSAKNLLAIINNILDFSKIEAGKLELEFIEFELEKVLDNVSSIVMVKLQKKTNIEFIINIDLNIPRYLIGDPLRLGQILINLAGNAAKFTEKGEIILSAELDKISDDKVLVNFAVRDTGIGMSESQIGKLFKAFSQAETGTTRKYGGTGLGLAISKQLVELMGSTLEVQSEADLGSIFSFNLELPIVDKQEIETTKSLSAMKGMKVLIIDDNSTSRDILLSIFSSFNFKPIAVDSGEKGLKELKQAFYNNSPYKLVIVDWEMPNGIDGIKTIKMINKSFIQGERPKIILLTAYGKEKIIKLAKKNNVDLFLNKPVSASMLLDSLAEIFNKKIKRIKQENIKEVLSDEYKSKLGGAKVLLVEDNKINQEIAIEFLERVNIEVETADNGKVAVNKIDSDSKYDLILMDIQMPIMDGNETAKIIRKKGILVPIVAMTANAIKGEEKESFAAGMNDYITKPINPEILYKTLLKRIKTGKFGKDTYEDKITKNGNDSSEIRKNESLYHSFYSLNGINYKEGIILTGGKPAHYKKLLTDFYSEFKNISIEFKKLADNSEYKKARIKAHTLKSISANLGVAGLSECSTFIENAFKNNDYESFINYYDKFKNEFESVFKSLKNIVSEEKDSEIETKQYLIKEKFDIDNFQKKANKLIHSLKAGNPSECSANIDTLLATEVSDDIKSELDKTAALITKYKFKDALNCINNILMFLR